MSKRKKLSVVQSTSGPQPGDVGFASNKDFMSRQIQRMERRKYGKSNPEAATWNHCFIVVSFDGDIVEAVNRGVVRSNLSGYTNQTYTVYRPNYAKGRAADAVLAALGQLGEPYGKLIIVSELLVFLTGTRLRFGLQGTSICSGGVVASSLDRAGLDMGGDEEWSSPSDVFQVATDNGWTKLI